jgi:hypothetical protein
MPGLVPGIHVFPPAPASKATHDMTLPANLRPREILFIDPGVDDVATITGNLRPGVAAVLLDSASPASRQIAAALAHRRPASARRGIPSTPPRRARRRPALSGRG